MQIALVRTLCTALRFSVASSLYLHACPKILPNCLITNSCGDDFCLISLCDCSGCHIMVIAVMGGCGYWPTLNVFSIPNCVYVQFFVSYIVCSNKETRVAAAAACNVVLLQYRYQLSWPGSSISLIEPKVLILSEELFTSSYPQVMDPFHILLSHFFDIHFSIIL